MKHTMSFLRPLNVLWGEQAANLLVVGLGLACAVLYAPALGAYFISDDFGTVAFLFFNRNDLNQLPWFLFQSNDGGIYFRPLGQLFYFIDWSLWGLNPFGYHLTNVIFHALNCILVYVLAARLSASRRVGFIAAILFAVMSVHSEAVAWIGARYDVICALFFLSSVLSFVLFRQRQIPKYYLVSLAMFLLALSSKEIAITLPFVLLVYDLVCHRSTLEGIPALFRRHLPYWGILGIVFLTRGLVFGRIGYGIRLDWNAFSYWLDKTISRVLNPLMIDDPETLRWLVLAAALSLIWFYRSRRELILGAVWIPLVYIATFNSGASERSFYIPSFGLALALASIIAHPLPRWQSLYRPAGATILIVLALIYGDALYAQNQQFQIAGEVARAIPDQVKASHSNLPTDARLVFTGIPDELTTGALIYITGLTPSFQLTYRNPTLSTMKVAKFPILKDGLDKTLFFEVDHRRVKERADIVQMLQERSRCAGSERILAGWDFASDPLGWEPWNDIAAFEIQDEAITMRAEGNDPVLGGPSINVSAIEIGEIGIVMRVQANGPVGRGSIFWLATGQNDFSPDLQESFTVQTDGLWHTYRADIGDSGKLFIGDQIRQLRLDPLDAPAQIAVKSIKMFAKCALR